MLLLFSLGFSLFHPSPSWYFTTHFSAYGPPLMVMGKMSSVSQASLNSKKLIAHESFLSQYLLFYINYFLTSLKMHFKPSSYLVKTSEETLCSPIRLPWTSDYCFICCCCYCCSLCFNCRYKRKWQRSRKVQTKIQYVDLRSHPVSAWRWESIQYAAKGSQDVFIAPRNTIGLTMWSGLIITTSIGQIYTPWLFVSFFQLFGIKNINRWDKHVWRFQRKESRNYKSSQDLVCTFCREHWQLFSSLLISA